MGRPGAQWPRPHDGPGLSRLSWALYLIKDFQRYIRPSYIEIAMDQKVP
jgi:hypothetical protein